MELLREYLVDTFGSAVEDVYIQPPDGALMKYPCVSIERATGTTSHADNKVYRHQKAYVLTGIARDTDSPLYDILAALPRSRHDRSFAADNLMHDVFTIFFKEEEND